MSRNDARSLRAEAQLRWQAGDGGGAMWKTQQADAAEREHAGVWDPVDGEEPGDEADPLAREFPVLDPTTGRRFADEWSMQLSRQIEADPNRVRRALRRWVNGLRP